MTSDLDDFVNGGMVVYQRVAKAVFVYCGERHLAEDSAQEAMMRAWLLVESGEPPRSLEAWMMTAAFNWCRTQLRRRSTGTRVVEALANEIGVQERTRSLAALPEGQADPIGAELSAVVHDAVLALPERQRQVVALHYLADMDVASTAKVCGISHGAVKNALFNARSTLAESLNTMTPGGVDDDR